jgi:nucleoside-diphosphate-sugar epimerase
MKRVLVTGAAGTIGKAVVTHMQAAGWDVLPVIRPESQRSIKGGIAVDLSQQDRDIGTFLSQRPEALVHLAAVVPHTGKDNAETYRRNRTMDYNVITFARELDIPLIYASGLSLYSDRSDRYKIETDPIRPIGFYLKAKAEGEKLSLQHKSACVMRIGGPIGCGRSGGIVRKFLDQVFGEDEITVWGQGSREQDFIDVRDIGDFVEIALQRRATGIFNVTSGRPVTMLELAKLIIDVSGRGKIVLSKQTDPEEGFKARFSIDKTASLGWAPRFTLRESIAWLINQM